METIKRNKAAELLEYVGGSNMAPAMELLAEADAKFLNDLKLNLKAVLKEGNLSTKEIALIGLAVAVNEKNSVLIDFFKKSALEAEADAADVAEAAACASLLSTNNVLYRFRHFTEKDSYANMPAKIRMSIMMTPKTGKAFFELMSTAISAVNGCQACVQAHEASLLHLGVTEAKIFDAIRLSAVVVGFSKIVH